ncbi:MAG: MBOAT family protein [Bacteroidales bacterium]|nr:MBOAT family protein [Bacteroidales bacterium]
MDILRHPFTFDQNHPLFLNTLDFWVFLFAVLFIYSFIYKTNILRNAYLFLVSVFFYYKTGGFFFAVMLLSIVSNYLLGFAIHGAKKELSRKLWLACSIILSLGILLFFKYELFLGRAINQLFGTDILAISHATKWSNLFHGTNVSIVDKAIPPVGISFFTFQCLSYTIDVYRGHTRPVRWLTDFGFFVSFFPQLVMGPIIRAADFIPQLYKKYSLSARDFGLAAYLILIGMTKKLMIGDYLAMHLIDDVFKAPGTHTGFENIIALFGYSVQVYCDFSGYTDMAIGLALLLGFHLPKNFNSPYKARSVGEFWKRWHISLSSWLKDYLYIPMGGSRNSSYFTYISLSVILLFVVLLANKLVLIPVFILIIGTVWLITRYVPSVKLSISTNINLMMTMLLGGLWHGSTWMFLVWGGLNGLGLVVYKMWKKISPYENKTHWAVNAWKVLLTFTFITFTRIWFRGETFDGTLQFFHQVRFFFGWDILSEQLGYYWKELVVMLVAMVIHWLPESLKARYRDWFIERPLSQQIGIITLAVLIIYQALSGEMKPFIYFQF